MIVLGIDPGKTGGLAFIWDVDATGTRSSVSLKLVPMPVLKSAKGRDEYNLAAIAHELQPMLDIRSIAFLERLHPMPLQKGGTIANFNRGASTHLFIGLFVGLGIPYHLVLPQVWQRAMLDGTSGADTKQRSIIAAQRIFPGVSFLPTERSRKPSHGLTDAALIAEYGRRRLAGDVGAQRGLLGASA